MTDTPVVWFNSECSKCRTTQDILAERGIAASYVNYLSDTPSKERLRRVLSMLGASDARAIARTSEKVWRDLALDDATDEQILDAMVMHPILIERPIVMIGERAVIARPPERVLELLDGPDRT